MKAQRKKLIEASQAKLIQTKEDILNRVKTAREQLHLAESKGGDEADQTVRALAEAEFLRMNARSRKRLLEIEVALSRIEEGTYGICEETEEAIEEDRLMAIPWTRLSIEGAEIRESLQKRYAR